MKGFTASQGGDKRVVDYLYMSYCSELLYLLEINSSTLQ